MEGTLWPFAAALRRVITTQAGYTLDMRARAAGDLTGGM